MARSAAHRRQSPGTARVLLSRPGLLTREYFAVLALKRVYRTTVVGALWRTAVIGPVYTIVIFATALTIGLGWLALRSPGASSG